MVQPVLTTYQPLETIGFAEALTPLKTQLVLGIIVRHQEYTPSIQLVEAQLVSHYLAADLGRRFLCPAWRGVSQPENNRLTVRVAMTNNASTLAAGPPVSTLFCSCAIVVFALHYCANHTKDLNVILRLLLY